MAGADERAEGRGLGPAVLRGVDEPVDQPGHAERGGQRTGEVELAGLALGLVDEQRAEDRERDADRDVDEEDPAPAHPGGERAAGEQADGGTRAGDRGEDTEGAVALLALGEVGGDQGQGRRRGERTADTLQGAEGEQLTGVLREAAEQRRDGEQQDARLQHAAAAHDVAEAATEQEQSAEGQRVGVEHPRQRRGGEVQRALDVRQRDVHDGRVEHDHQLGAREDGERGTGVVAPTGSAGHRGCVVSRCGGHENLLKVSRERFRSLTKNGTLGG